MSNDSTFNKDSLKALEELIGDTISSVIWTHKVHEKQADIYSRKHIIVTFVNIFVSAVSTGCITWTINNDSLLFKSLAIILSVITLSITAFDFYFPTKQLSENHKKTATSLLLKREQFKYLLYKTKYKNCDISNLEEEFSKLKEDLYSIYANAPITTDAALEAAAVALLNSKDSEFDRNKINEFLPDSLKL